MPAASRTRNAIYAGALALLAGTFALAPLLLKEKYKNHNLTTSEKALVGSQIMRGAYINTGSKDAGPDPDWDPHTHAYKGRSLRSFNPSAEDVELHRKALAAKRAAIGLTADVDSVPAASAPSSS